MNFFEYIQDLNLLSVVIRVAMAVACGGILGLERKRAGHASGMRTYMLMSLGAAIVSLTSQYMYNYFSESHPDAERLGAQVISGAAVLAASVIVVSKRQSIKGITTAASMWASACVGLAIGIGFYWAGIIGTAGIYVIMTVFHRIETNYMLKAATIGLNVEASDKETILNVAAKLQELGVEISDIRLDESVDVNATQSIFYENEENACVGELMVKSKHLKHDKLLNEVVAMDGVRHAWYSI